MPAYPDIDPLTRDEILHAQVAREDIQPGQRIVASRTACDGRGLPLLIDVDRLQEWRARRDGADGMEYV